MMNESKSKKRIFFGIFFIGMLLVVCSIAITVLVIDSSRDDHVVDIAIDKVTYGDYIVLSVRYCPNINDDIEYLILLYDPYGKIRFDLSDYEDGPGDASYPLTVYYAVEKGNHPELAYDVYCMAFGGCTPTPQPELPATPEIDWNWLLFIIILVVVLLILLL